MKGAQTEGVDTIVMEGSGELRTELDPAELSHHLSDPGSLIWCDITGTEGGQQGPQGRLLREVFGFDELTIEDCFTTNHLPKVDIYDDYIFVAFFSFHLSEKRQRVETVEVDMYVGENYVVCIHPRPHSKRTIRTRVLLIYRPCCPTGTQGTGQRRARSRAGSCW
jgi:magnesium transporter